MSRQLSQFINNSINLNDIAILKILGVDYEGIINTNKLQNADLTDIIKL